MVIAYKTEWPLAAFKCSSVLFQTNPLLIRVDTKSGHGHGKPTSKTIEEITDVYSFLVRSLGLEYKKGRPTSFTLGALSNCLLADRA